MRAMRPGAAWIAISLLAAAALAGQAPEPDAEDVPVLLRADLFAREGANILYAIGNVRLRRGEVLVTADAAVVWTADQEAYLEGHVVYHTGQSSISARRAYIHWVETKDSKTGKDKTTIDRGFLFRAVVHWNEREDKIPWHVRAEEVLQHDINHFRARGEVILTTCSFHEPHVYFRASEVELVTDEKLIATDISYHARGVSLKPLWFFPIYWPKLYIPLGWRWPEINVDAGRSSRFGAYARSEVIYTLPRTFLPELHREIGVRLDYFSKRGPAYGGLFRYELDRRRGTGVLGRDLLTGELEGYRVPEDDGEDQKEFQLGREDRWRVKFVHSQDIPEGFEFDIEFQRYSDAGFRQEYFEQEYEEHKPVENRVYLKYARGPFAFYFHTRWNENDWIDTTEYLPQAGVNIFSFPIVSNLLYTGHFEIANIRRRLSDLRLVPFGDPNDPAHVRLRRRNNFFFDPLESTLQEFRSDGRRFWRFNTYHELSFPFDVGIFDIEPFVATRQTWYEEVLDGSKGQWRGMFVYGGRISTQFWRSWDDAKATHIGDCPILPLQVDGLRHVITPEIRFLSIERPTIGTDQLILTDDTHFLQPTADYGYDWPWRPYHPYDPVGLAFGDIDAIDPVRLLNIGLRNRWQTRRDGGVVDLIDIDANIDFYSREDRDNMGRNWSDFRVDFRFNPVRGILFFADFDYNVSGNPNTDAGRFGCFNSGLYISTSKRWQLLLSQRYEANAFNRFGVQLIYNISEKWRVSVQYEHDTNDSDTDDFSLRLARDMHDWIAEFVFQDGRDGLQRLVGISVRPKTRRELISGLEYTRDLRAGLDARSGESVQQFDY